MSEEEEVSLSECESEDSDVKTRSLVRDQNRKKKKSGGFQAMGWYLSSLLRLDLSYGHSQGNQIVSDNIGCSFNYS